MKGRLGDELLPPSSAKPGLVMNKPAIAGACVRCAPVAYAPGASQHTGASRRPAVCAVRVVGAPVESCLRTDV
jgi:hypothetical protein